MESTAYCLHLVCMNNYEELKNLLPNYFLLRELAAVLSKDVDDKAKAAIVGVLAVILKESCEQVYVYSQGFSIRVNINYYLIRPF